MQRQDVATKRYIQSFYHKNRGNFIVALSGIILNAGAGILLSYLVGRILDAMTSGSLAQLERLVIPNVCALVVLVVTNLLQYRFKTRFIHRGIAQYKETVFEDLIGKNISAFTKENTSRYLSILTNDAATIEQNYLNNTLLMVYNSILFVGSLVVMLYLSWRLALLSIVLSGIPLIYSMYLGKQLTQQERQVSDRNEGFVAQTKDFLSGFTVVKGFKAEAQAKKAFSHENRTVEQLKGKRRWLNGFLYSISDFFGYTMQFCVFLCGSYLTIQHQSTAGAMLSIVSLSNFIFQPIQVVPGYWAGRKACKGLIEKAAQLSRENWSESGKPLPQPLTGGIQFDHVSFDYGTKSQVLHDVSVNFDMGKTYAVVGASGSGKTTLLNLLMGGYKNYTGSIRLSNMELRDIDTDSLYRVISTIDQNVFLFDASIHDNITMFQDFPSSKVETVIRQSGLAELVDQKGMEYKCGENGVNLSGGERQRVSIARCLLRETPILMLDEATAALDQKTAFEVTESILKLSNLTRIIVTHRLDQSLLRQFDAIVVLKNGKIVECGGFEELMEQKNYFYSLYTISGV